MFRAVLAVALALGGAGLAKAAGLPRNAAKPEKCTTAQGQTYIDEGRYPQAIREFTCVINAQPTEVEGYRGRIEAQLLIGEYSNAVRDYSRVTAFVQPAHPDAQSTILAGYAARLAAAPDNIPALTGASFARWWFFQYAQAIHVLDHLLVVAPNNVYGNLFRGSTRVLSGATPFKGVADIERALVLAPLSPDVRFIVADAYTYGQPDPARAFTEASLALSWGLDTPRIHTILASAYLAFGDLPAAAVQLKIHIDQVTTELTKTAALGPGGTLSLPLVPGRTYEIPLAVTAGQTLSIATSSRDFYDTVLVLLAPDGSPVVGSDDTVKYFAALDWVSSATGTYRMQVTSFESVNTGELVVKRK
jgi:tetratricopeptide (TPR) repeat protein